MDESNLAIVDPAAESLELRRERCLICFETFLYDDALPYNAGRLGHMERWCTSHLVCTTCVHRYISHEILEGKLAIPCCAGSRECPNFRASTALIISVVGFQLYHKLRENRTREEFSFACSDCGGKSFNLEKFDTHINNSTEFLCRECHASYCLFCREQLSSYTSNGRACFRDVVLSHSHHNAHQCKDEISQKLASHVLNPTNLVRACPHCFRFIHRYEGCPNMVCSGCQESFCWQCLSLEHHNSNTCLEYLFPKSLHVSALEKCKSTAQMAGNAAKVPIKLFIGMLALPMVAYRSFLEHQRIRRLYVAEQVGRHGIDVYLVPEGENDPDDTVDEDAAVQFLRAFVSHMEPGHGVGRWDDPENKRCFMAFRLLSGSTVVRVHPHGRQDRQCLLCPAGKRRHVIKSSYSVKVDIADLTEAVLVPPQEGVAVALGNSPVDLVERKCRMALKKLGAPMDRYACTYS